MNKKMRCLMCTHPIPGRYSRMGYPHKSLWLWAHDEAMLFCTLKCAAIYGIRAAKGNPVYSKRHEQASAIHEEMKRQVEERIAADKAACEEMKRQAEERIAANKAACGK